MTRPVALSEDGLPTDPTLRRLAGRTIGVAYHLAKDARLSRDQFVKLAQARWMTEREPGIAAAVPVVVDILIAGGFLETGPGGCHVPRKVYDNGGDGDTTAARLAAVARGLGARCMPGGEGAEALARLFLDLRALCFVFTTDAANLEIVHGSGEAGLLVPEAYAVDGSAGATMSGAHLILFGRPGPVRAVHVPGAAIACRFPAPGNAVVTVDLSRAVPWKDGVPKFTDMGLSPIRGRRLIRTEKAAFEPSWVPLQRQRAEASRLIGAPIAAQSWRRFTASAGRSPKLGGHVSRLLWQTADPEARACCQRAPYATLGLYGWFSPADPVRALRRRQASAAYPCLTHRLREVEGAIDRGEPLEPALAARLGLPSVLVRHLRGRHWQELGRVHSKLLDGVGTGALGEIVAEIPPERLPRGKRGWAGFHETIGVLQSTLSWPASRPLVRPASADWGRLPALAWSTGLGDAMRLTSWDISLACDEGIRSLTNGAAARTDDAAREALATWVLGDDGGLARIERFAREWHRGVSARTIERMRIEREVWGDAPVSWVPLTARPFATPHGTLSWITGAQDLVDEGTAMGHCVGSHQFACLYGESHVAKVEGARGGRSTVEFSWSCTRGPTGRMAHRVAVLEHKAARNAEPPEDCLAAVAGFVERGARSVDRKPVAAGLKARATHLAARRVPMPPWGREALMRSYDPCLARYGAGLTASDWVGRILASIHPRHRGSMEPWDDDGSAPVPRREPSGDALPF